MDCASYEVSSLGAVRRSIGGQGARLGVNRKLVADTHGYLQVKLCEHGKCRLHLVSRLVAKAFLPNPLGLPEVNHVDGKRQNNTLSNLEWCSSSANIQHAYDVLNRRSPGGHNVKDYTAIDPSGQVHAVHNLSAFAEAHGLHQGACTLVAQGKRNHHKGWLFAYA